MYIAHVKEDSQEIQSLEAHLNGVGEIAKDLGSKLGLPKSAELIGLLHDLGKYSSEFQNYIKSATGVLDQDADDYVDSGSLKGKVDHSTAGAQFIHRNSPDCMAARFMALCIASHHSGLIDLFDSMKNDVYLKRMSKDTASSHIEECLINGANHLAKCKELLPGAIEELEAFLSKTKSSAEPGQQAAFHAGLACRMLFSCLIDADRTDTALFERPYRRSLGVGNKRTKVPWQQLIDKLESRLKDFEVRNHVDEARNEVSEACREAANSSLGIFSLTVPTGGGKTLASLRFALHHALRHDLDKVIFIVPYTSITEQSADVARSIFGDMVLEHHCNIAPDKESWKTKALSESWDSQIIFTTQVQFLEACFGARTRGVRRMAALASAVIVFDEAQTVPVRILNMFCQTVNFLAAHSSLVLCTATQPALTSIPQLGKLRTPKEIIPDVPKLFSVLKRVEVRNLVRPEGWTLPEVTSLMGDSSILICNTKSTAANAFSLIGDGYHLSTAMCQAHRSDVLSEVRRKLKAGEPVKLVSTQLVEAGVDLDFESGIRILAGMDSIAQAAGRVNRNGLRPTGVLSVVNLPDEKLRGLPDIQAGQTVSRYILDKHKGDLLAPEVIEDYFKRYYQTRAAEMGYRVKTQEGKDTELFKLLADNNVRRYDGQAFMTAANLFRAIDTEQISVVCPYNEEAVETIEQMASIDPQDLWKLTKKMQRYSVGLFAGSKFDRMLQSGQIAEAQEGLGIYYLTNGYDDKLGVVSSSTLSTLVL